MLRPYIKDTKLYSYMLQPYILNNLTPVGMCYDPKDKC